VVAVCVLGLLSGLCPARAQDADAPADTPLVPAQEPPADAAPRDFEDVTRETRFVLAAKPEFHGNDHFGDERLQRIVGLEAGGEMPLYLKDDYARQIEEIYREAGYPLVRVQAQMRGMPGVQAVVLVFRIAEGPRVAVSEIVFEGNDNVPSDELREVMQSRERWNWLPFIQAGRFRRRRFENDVRRVQDALYDRGYLDAVAGGDVQYLEDKARVRLRVLIHEGELYHVEDVIFEGNRLFRDEELLEAIPLEVGGTFSPDDLDKAVEKIEGVYARSGHPDVTQRKDNLAAVPVLAQEGAGVVVRFHITEGPLVRVGRIHVRGLVRTRENVVRRNLTFYPGEVASNEEFERSESLLINTGAFQRSRNAVQIELAPGDEAVRDVIVRVQEGPTANLVFSGGFGSRDGFFGEISLSEDNFDITNWPTSWRDLLHGNAFRGAGHKLSIRLYGSQEATRYSLSFLNPSVGDGPYSAGFDLYNGERSREFYDEGRAGFSVNGGRRITKFIDHRVTVGYESVDVDDVPATAPAVYLRDEGSHARPFVQYVARSDRRDNRFLPTEGYFLQALTEYAAGDVDAARVQLQSEKYFTLLENDEGGRHVLALRGELGVVDSVGGDRVPVFERFFAGGFRSIRGFEYEGVAPVAPGTDDQVGGESMLTGSVEYMLPVRPERFHVLVFADGGYVKEDAADVLNGWDELRLAVGLGARFSLGEAFPGNIEVSFAQPVMEQEGDESQSFQFSFGAGARF
jgi:outer membrane protein insertion porin family